MGKKLSRAWQVIAIGPNWRVKIYAWLEDVGNNTWANIEPTNTYTDTRTNQVDVAVEDANDLR